MYASVAVNISIGRQNSIFTYRIPEALQERAVAGVSCIVPFGKGGRTVKGYITEILDDAGMEAERIKDIISLDTNDVDAEARLVKLAGRISRDYGCSMAVAMRTVMPVKSRVKEKTDSIYVLSVSEYEADLMITKLSRDRRAAVKLRALNAIRQRGELKLSELKEEYGVSKQSLSALIRDGLIEEKQNRIYRAPELSLEDKTPVEALNDEQARTVADILDEPERVHLIHGVTGSGKTEVYIALIKEQIKRGRQAIMLIPEIALTTQMFSRFQAVFGDRITVMNSRMSDGERYDQYIRILNGEADVVIGPRTAVFMPFSDLGLIIIDEEHSASYKNEQVPRYSASEIAMMRREDEGATVVLGSATPSVASYYRCEAGEYVLHTMEKRAVAGAELPETCVIDMREELRQGNRSIFSRRLKDQILDRLRKKEQVMLFLNRRGFAGCISCRSCGHVIKCPHCDVSMTVHNDGTMKCHYCGETMPVPAVCPECGSKFIGTFGTGTQKVEYYIRKEFPGARVLRLDRDTASGKDGADRVIAAFRDGEADILVGTQMIANGHDFRNVTLAGILAADLSLYGGDYMSGERTFQLLLQVGGRAGRTDKPGEVTIQTYSPDHYAVRSAAERDYLSFYEKETEFRSRMGYPPFGSMLHIRIESADEEKAVKASASAAGIIRQAYGGAVNIIGPSEASLAKGKDIYRRTVYIKSRDRELLRDIIRDVMSFAQESLPRDVHVSFDPDPVNSY
ncbi:MAG: primosomal protein N' [Lachnospiraceae bacterium]|nr:primosomal protein N' [Lachnospiraceae bacterium]